MFSKHVLVLVQVLVIISTKAPTKLKVLITTCGIWTSNVAVVGTDTGRSLWVLNAL